MMSRKLVYFILFKLKRFCYVFVCAFIPSKQLRHKVRDKFVFYDRDVYFKLPCYYGLKKTVKLLQKGYSLARFGDGEFYIMVGGVIYVFNLLMINYKKNWRKF